MAGWGDEQEQSGYYHGKEFCVSIKDHAPFINEPITMSCSGSDYQCRADSISDVKDSSVPVVQFSYVLLLGL